MNELQMFGNSEFGVLGVMTVEGKPWFPATDSAKLLGYADPYDAIKRHTKGSVKHRVLTDGGEQLVNFIPEGDLFRLIVHSKLPAAERFERWVFDEVLPSIRKYGMYATEKTLSDPDVLMATLRALKTAQERADDLERKLKWERSGAGRAMKRTPAMKALPEQGVKLFIDELKAAITRGDVNVMTLPVAELPDENATSTIGFTDGEYLYALPQRTYDTITQQQKQRGETFPLTKRMLFKSLRAGGLATCDAEGKTTRAKQVAGRMMRLLWLPYDALDEMSEEV